jgi:DNA-binding GntR family transcriptional regulator
MTLTASVGEARSVSWQRKTRAEELRLQLADEIVRGALVPGTALDEITLADRFHVSRTPVREAIRLLAASGLVGSASPSRRRGRAAKCEIQLADMFESMAELEALCAGFAAERMTRAERRTLEDIHDELRVMIQSGDPQRYHEVNEAFHNSIYAGAHNTYLAEITLSTRARVQPFRRAQFRNLGRLAKSHIEHDRVVQAILRGEQSIAASAMYAHIVTVRDEYEAYTEAL